MAQYVIEQMILFWPFLKVLLLTLYCITSESFWRFTYSCRQNEASLLRKVFLGIQRCMISRSPKVFVKKCYASSSTYNLQIKYLHLPVLKKDTLLFEHMIILVSRRKSLSGNWKTNIGQSLLEEIPVSGHHKLWIDEVRAFECLS